jgi:hypothetical protein
MGHFRHSAIVVTSWDEKALKVAHEKAIELFSEIFERDLINNKQLISPIISGVTNNYGSFMIGPDGSKEGWETSKLGDKARKEFQDWVFESDTYVEYCEIKFGGDGDYDYIIRSNNKDLGFDENE